MNALGAILRKRCTGRAWRLLRPAVCCVVAALLTIWMVEASLREGRLSTYPQFDDVAYLHDGLRRLTLLRHEGFASLIADYRRWPPHAPISTLFAFAGFAMLGAHDWAPYVVNGLLVFGYLLIGARLLHGIRLWQMLLMLGLLAVLPLSLAAVLEFRPDFAASLFTVAGMLALLLPEFFGDSVGANLFAGVCFGVAALAKPPFIPATLCLLIASLLLRRVARRIVDPALSADRIGRSWLACVIPAVLIPLTHYLVAWHDIASYIYEVQLGSQRSVWAIHGSILYHATYYLTGPGEPSSLGAFVGVIAVLLLLGTFLILCRRRRRELALLVLMPASLLAYLIPTLNPHKQPSFALCFQLLLVYSATIVARRSFLTLKPRLEPTVAAVLVLLLLGGVWHSARRMTSEHRLTSERDSAHTRIARNLYQTLTGTGSGAAPNRVTSVVLTGIGAVNADLLGYWGLKEGLNLNCYTPGFVADIKPFECAFGSCDLVVAGDSRSEVFKKGFPSDSIRDALITELKSRPDFRLVGQFQEEQTGGTIYVFQAIHRPH